MKKEILGERLPYLTRERGYGQGEVRIGSSLGCGNDIYSLGFIAQIADTIMDKHFDVIKGELIEEEEKEEKEDIEEQVVVSLNAEPVTNYALGDQ